MSARKMRRTRNRALAAGTAISLSVAVPAASAAEIPVTNNNNAGPGSLRQAMATATSNGPADHDTITFAPNVTGEIDLSAPLDAFAVMTVDGPGPGVLKIDGGNDVALVAARALGVDLEIEGLTIEGRPALALSGNEMGEGPGVTIRNSVLTGDVPGPGQDGGAVKSLNNDVRIIGSTISGSNAGRDGGGIFFRGAGSAADDLTIVDSQITGNSAGRSGGGVAVPATDGVVTIARSRISGNSAASDGGGIHADYSGAVSIGASTISGNSSADSGGGLFVNAPDGPFTISNSTVAGNVAAQKGAGIYSFGYFDKPVTIANSTIAQNTGAVSGGGIFRFGYDGAGPGYEGPDEIAVSSTIVANNSAGTGPDLAQGPIADGSFVLRHSLVSSTAGGAATIEDPPGINKLDTGPIEIGPLADNGGPTQTMLPALGGPAIDAGVANALTTDQRGLARTVDQPLVPSGTGSDGTDIGAVELADSELSGATLKAKGKQKQKGKKVKVVVEVSAAEPATASASGTVKLGKKGLPLTKPSTELSAGESGKLQLKPKGKRATKKIAKALAKGKKAKASVTVAFTDPAGNADEESTKTRLVD